MIVLYDGSSRGVLLGLLFSFSSPSFAVVGRSGAFDRVTISIFLKKSIPPFHGRDISYFTIIGNATGIGVELTGVVLNLMLESGAAVFERLQRFIPEVQSV